MCATARAAIAAIRNRSLLDVLASEVVLVSDGGGVKHAALRPVIVVGGSPKVEARA
ncbi:hypothetical protein APR12_003097 [Nocardia amikacinitolerans]|nr:hypothetical protein [Nocardia amikacinitolerans]